MLILPSSESVERTSKMRYCWGFVYVVKHRQSIKVSLPPPPGMSWSVKKKLNIVKYVLKESLVVESTLSGGG